MLILHIHNALVGAHLNYSLYKSPRTHPNHRSKMAEVHAMPPISHESSEAERFGENHNDERINSQDDYYEDYRQVRINGRLIDADWEYGEERQYHDIDDYDYPLFRERPNQTMVPARPFRLLRPLEECVSPSEQTYILAT